MSNLLFESSVNLGRLAVKSLDVLPFIVACIKERSKQAEWEEKRLDGVLGAEAFKADNLAAKLPRELKAQGHLAAL